MLELSLLFAILLSVIASLPYGIIVTGHPYQMSLALHELSPFMADFIAIFTVFIICSYFIRNKMSYWAGALLSISASLALSYMRSSVQIHTLYGFIEAFAMFFSFAYISNVIGAGVSVHANTALRKIILYPVRTIIIFVFVILIGSIVMQLLPTLSTLSNYTAIQNSIAGKTGLSQKLDADISLITHKSGMINNTWATQFFDNVSAERNMTYNFCPSLNAFATIRFYTMESHYQISHYGYNADLNRTYGIDYNIYFGEEIFYPAGYSPSQFVSQIREQAPLHWTLLANPEYTQYGYHIQNGTTYVIYGPDGGAQSCPQTEVPGPNINVSQYFAQYGCTVRPSNSTWFVIEMASSCPGS
jgi:hypothetical protein